MHIAMRSAAVTLFAGVLNTAADESHRTPPHSCFLAAQE